MAAPESEPARRAALLLHGLPAASRAQVLQGLAPAEQARLKPLLTELTAIGVPASLGKSLFGESRPVPRGRHTPMEELDALAAAAVIARLEGCASGMLAELLRSRDWSWKPEVLAALPEWRRRAVLTAMHAQTAPLKPAVIDIVGRRLLRIDSPDLPATRAAPRGLLARLVERCTWSR
jgi:hypothetical protein